MKTKRHVNNLLFKFLFRRGPKFALVQNLHGCLTDLWTCSHFRQDQFDQWFVRRSVHPPAFSSLGEQFRAISQLPAEGYPLWLAIAPRGWIKALTARRSLRSSEAQVLGSRVGTRQRVFCGSLA